MQSIADVYCMPSVSEPFGLSAIEAAQFGIPAVISKQSGAAEVMKGSLTFDFWDINRASEYIIKLLDDEVLKNKVIDDANTDLKSISWDLSAEKVLQGYDKYKLFLS
ncbi:MAG: glycosyltransferase [Bacteroidetes bacterium]|nr:glycosyltransferase [Bacteroidota bacterium]